MKITKELFGKTKTGDEVQRFTLENQKGTQAKILTYGGIVQAFVFQGVDVVLGFDTVAGYEAQDGYIGAILGRFANRIGGGEFCLNGKTYPLFVNNGPNHLHGGREGFDRKLWRADAKAEGLTLSYTSVDGEEGYPATLTVAVTYALDEEDGLSITYEAQADGDTVVNLSNHSYFNLSGHDQGTLSDHEVQLFAKAFTENDENALPTGEIRSVVGTPMDFTMPRDLLADIDQDYDQLIFGNGYDHNWIIDGDGFRLCAIGKSRETEIVLSVFTDQVGVQMYTANFLQLQHEGKGGAVYPRRGAVCFETQGFPNATSHGHFPTAVLRQGEVYRKRTVYQLRKEK